jgi:hypothetical protein
MPVSNRGLVLGERKASVAVEFALISTFFLLPLLLGSSDFLMIISARAQLNTALQALYYFAWTNPSSASDSTELNQIISVINGQSIYQIQLTNPTVTYVCVTPGATPTYVTQTSPGQCGQGAVQQTLVSYSVSTTVTLPITLPGIGSPYSMTFSGKIQTQ